LNTAMEPEPLGSGCKFIEKLWYLIHLSVHSIIRSLNYPKGKESENLLVY